MRNDPAKNAINWLAVVSAIAVAVVAACSDGGSPTPPAPLPASPWAILYSTGTPASMGTDNNANYYFDFPAAPGSVHYITHAALAGRQTIQMRFQIVGDGQLIPTEGTASAKVRLFIQRRGDNLSGAGEYEHYRFWSPPLDLVMGDSTIEAKLDPAIWTSVYGKTNAEGFAACLNDLESVGFTFGGTFAGHGVYVQNGSARFILLAYDVY